MDFSYLGIEEGLGTDATVLVNSEIIPMKELSPLKLKFYRENKGFS